MQPMHAAHCEGPVKLHCAGSRAAADLQSEDEATRQHLRTQGMHTKQHHAMQPEAHDPHVNFHLAHSTACSVTFV